MLPWHREQPRVGYVVKRYPRYSETFIVNEVLGHEAAGLPIDIYSLMPPVDTHFQDAIARVRAGVFYLHVDGAKAAGFWQAVREAAAVLPGIWDALGTMAAEDVRDVHQAVLLARHARERDVALLHAHFASGATSVARLAARIAGIPYTFTAHAKDIYHESVDPADLGRKLRDADAIVTVSEFNRAHLHATYGDATAALERVYNGLDLDRFAWCSPAERAPRVVAVGRFVEKKGFDTLIDACALLARAGTRVECDIIGMGELEAALRARIEALGLAPQVRLLGPCPQAEVIERVRHAAVFAAPCVEGSDGNRDGLPTALLEAMALGTPCISTDVTGIPEVLHDGETGLMVPQRDAHALAAAIARLLADRALGARLAGNARRLIEAEFDIRVTTQQLRAVFERALVRAC